VAQCDVRQPHLSPVNHSQVIAPFEGVIGPNVGKQFLLAKTPRRCSVPRMVLAAEDGPDNGLHFNSTRQAA
jgi:hypothetical protein